MTKKKATYSALLIVQAICLAIIAAHVIGGLFLFFAVILENLMHY